MEEFTFVGIEVVLPNLGDKIQDFIIPVEKALISNKLKSRVRNAFWNGPIPLDTGIGLKLTGKPLSIYDCEFILEILRYKNKNWNKKMDDGVLILTYEI